MSTHLVFSKTYLYKLHTLTNTLDRAFDRVLRKYAGLGLSQFTLLLAVAEHRSISQHNVASFLGVSPGAVSRRVGIATQNGYLSVDGDPSDRRGQILKLTIKGEQVIAQGLRVLEEHVLQIFDDHDRLATLIEHIDLLNNQIKEVVAEQNHQRKVN